MAQPDDHELRVPRSYSLTQAIAVALPVALTAISGSLATRPAVGTWYAALRKPAFTPPDAVFGPVWGVLYVTVAIAGWRVISLQRHSPGRDPAVKWFYVQLALNAAWPWAFFGAQSALAGMVVILAHLAAVAVTVALFGRVDRLAAVLMIPYLLWVAFAAYLNFGVLRLN